MGNLALQTRRAIVLLLPWVALLAQDAPDTRTKIAALEQQVQKYLQEQKPDLAIPVLTQLVSLDPKNLNNQANLGVLLCFQGKYPEAAPHLRAALELKPDLWKIESLLGIAEKRTGDAQGAQAHLEQAFANLDDQKIRMDTGVELIEIYTAAAQFDKALSIAGKLQELAPQNPRIQLIVYQLSRRMMDQSLLTLMTAAPDSAEIHMVMAGELGRQGDHAKSVAQYREALKLNPSLPGAHFEMAEQMRTASDPALNAQAEEAYKAAIRVNQYDELAWRQLGGIMHAKGDFKAAEEDYRKALALQPKDTDAKTGLAIVMISTNRNEEALSLLETAVKENPTDTVAHFRLSTLYRKAGRTADAERELSEFHHYEDLQNKLGDVFKQLAGQNSAK